MLDSEPGTPQADPATPDLPTAGDASDAPTSPRKPARRRSASRPAGPPVDLPAETPTGAVPDAVPDAVSGTEATDPAAPAAKKTAKRAPAKRAPRKTAKKAAAAPTEAGGEVETPLGSAEADGSANAGVVVEVPPTSDPSSDLSTDPTEAGHAQAAPSFDAPAEPARRPARKRAVRKAAAPVPVPIDAELDGAGPLAEPAVQPVVEPAAESTPRIAQPAFEAAADVAETAPPAPVAPSLNPFAVPDVAPRPSTDTNEAVEDDLVEDEPEDSPADTEDDPASITQDSADSTDSTEDSDDSDGEDEDDDSAEDSSEDSGEGRRRRRRRGGRRRRRGAGETEAGADDRADGRPGDDNGRGAGDDAEQSEQQGRSQQGDDQSGEDTDGENEESEGQRRRRRRRRRRGEDASNAPDDPSEVVVRVREPRSRGRGSGGSSSSDDKVTGIEGSTRMEAKRQRRRDGREAGRRRAPILSEAEFLARRESVARTMVIRQLDDANGSLAQIAVLEDDILVEHYVDRESATSLIGNVYLGRVQNVLPSMEAAFIDIGRGRNAVLYAGEVDWESFGAQGGERKVERVLKSGQTILVQVSKDPVGAKGARLTNHVSIPGRYLVYAPGGHLSGISRKLPDNERRRLKDILAGPVGDTASVIVRTAAEGASEDELVRDINRLKAQWESIEAKIKGGTAPQLLYAEPDLTIRIVRDLFTEDFAELIIQGNGTMTDAFDAVEAYASHVAPHLATRIRRWDAAEQGDLFGHYRLDEQIAKGLERKVFLPSGGSLIIDRTEAMTVVDVNTGKFTGSGGNLEATITSNNLEAAEEIVRQLRLRDIGGIIVIDFIDMVLPANRELLLRRLVECLGRDRTRHQVAEVTSLGLVQMTRKKIGTGLLEAFTTECAHCQGRGFEVHDMPVETQKQADGGARSDDHGRRGGKQGDKQGGDRNGSDRNGNDRNGNDRNGSDRNGGDRNGGRRSNRGGGHRDDESDQSVTEASSGSSSESNPSSPRPMPSHPRPEPPAHRPEPSAEATTGTSTPVDDSVERAVQQVLGSVAPVAEPASGAPEGSSSEGPSSEGSSSEGSSGSNGGSTGSRGRRGRRSAGRPAGPPKSAEPTPAAQPEPAGSDA